MKKKLLKFVSMISFAALFPIIAFAQIMVSAGTTQSCDSIVGFGKIICQIQQLLNSIVPVLIALGVVLFVWGVVMYVIADGEEAKKKGRDRIIYGIIGFAVIIGMWGLVTLVTNTFGFTGQSIIAPTTVSVTTSTSSGSTCTTPTDVQTFLGFFTCIINNSLIPLIFAVAIIMFIWGVVQYFIVNADEEAKRAQGKQFMIWGIIALAVMLSVWGLVGILSGSFGIHTSSVLPQVHP